MSLNSEIISVGTEIILGNILNTHSKFLSESLAALGINVYYHTAVGDNDIRFKSILKTALERSDMVFITGGLGPTTDDITKETVCEVLGISAHYDEQIGNELKAFFERGGKVMTDNNLKQAYVPEGAIVLNNDKGTAPGFIIENGDKCVILLPGPPRELVPMFYKSVKPYLIKKSSEVIASKSLYVYGIGESALEEKIEDLVASKSPTVALYAKTGQVLIRVTAKAKTEKEANTLIEGMIKKLYDRLDSLIYGVDIISMPNAVVSLLSSQNKTVATAESCTGGLLASQITDISGASKVFEMGAVTYANRIKELILGVSEKTLQTYGAVSYQTACEMALGLIKKSKADYAISITGIAGPTGGSEEKPVGTVYICVAHDNKCWCERCFFARYQNERDYIRESACLRALNMLRLTIIRPELYNENYKEYIG